MVTTGRPFSIRVAFTIACRSCLTGARSIEAVVISSIAGAEDTHRPMAGRPGRLRRFKVAGKLSRHSSTEA
ncbi:MAG: hypothetical protein KF694_21175 [Mesorhizobium sp.]|nr:hypothetical protein [Mesorhizobium sp.]